MSRLSAVALVGAALVLSWVPAAGAGPSPTHRYFQYDAARTVFHAGAVAPAAREPALGDSMLITSLIYDNRSRTKPVGHGEFFCTLTSRDGAACTATIFLRDGKLVSAGMLHFRRVNESPILGGTGAYEGARGAIVFTHVDERHAWMVIRLI